MARVVPAYVGSNHPGAVRKAVAESAGELACTIRRVEERRSDKPVDEPDGVLHGARPLGTPEEGVLIVPVPEQLRKLFEIAVVTRSEVRLCEDGELMVPVELPVGAYVARDPLGAERVVVREAHRPVAL